VGCGERGKQNNIRDALKKLNTVNGVSVEAKFIKGNEVNNLYTLSEDPFLYFNIRLTQPSLDPDPKTIEYINFKMEKDFSMLNSGDTILPVMVHRVVNGVKGRYEYLVAFERLEGFGQTGRVSILYEDKIFGIGTQVFDFRKEDILK
jgi:hypothetical protein